MFFIWRSVILFVLFLNFFFRFSVLLGKLLRYGHIVPNRKLNRIKNGLYEKNTGFPCLILNMGFLSSIIDTDQHGQNTEFFSLKFLSPYIDFNRLEKILDPYFLHFAQCYSNFLFLKKNFRFSLF